MEIDQEELLQRTYALAKENNKLLKKARHGAWIGFIFKLLFWGAMIGIPIWMYMTVLQPILQQVMPVVGQVQGLVPGGVSGMQGILDSLPSMDMLNQLQN